ncbi:hypothetical protein TQ33_0294 [Kangiella geojedonensis]|uniref:Uncharacterized protein n=1 Tax=Kangiella geojedonensis TaxID=914150 RepID=A0A0F6TP81_9GAMM|nr:hypothetical protein TQ33_0294 [Kangiella geojedonensis]
MIDMLRTAMFTVLILISEISAAVNSQWQTSAIEKIYPLLTGDFVLTFTEINTNCRDGASNAYYYVKEGVNGVKREGVKSMLSVALSAASMGKEITVNFDADLDSGAINRLYIKF